MAQENKIDQIMKHINAKEPAKVMELVGQEISARVMAKIEDKRAEVGSKLFNRR